MSARASSAGGAATTSSPKGLFSPDRLIWWLLLAAGVLRVAALLDKGFMYDGGFSDAIGYVSAARTLAATGRLTFLGTSPSATVMPGFVALIAPAFLVSKVRFVQYLIIKVAMIAASLASILVLYVLGRRIAGRRPGLIAAAFLAVSLPHIYAGTLALTENVFQLLLLALILLIIRLGDDPGWRRLMWCAVVFCAAVYVRQTALVCLPGALVYLLVRRYPPRLLLRQVLAVALIATIALTPWWIRNHQVFGEFVPFTTNGSYAVYEGTFQHFEPYDGRAFAAMDRLLTGVGGSEVVKNRLLGEAARARLASRLAGDPWGLVTDYLVRKPAAAWLLPFYWDRVLGVSGYWILRLNALGSVLGFFLLGWYSFRSRARAEYLLLLAHVALITVGAACYLGLSRYVYPFMPLLYIGIASFLEGIIVRVACQASALRPRSR